MRSKWCLTHEQLYVQCFIVSGRHGSGPVGSFPDDCVPVDAFVDWEETGERVAKHAKQRTFIIVAPVRVRDPRGRILYQKHLPSPDVQ